MTLPIVQNSPSVNENINQSTDIPKALTEPIQSTTCPPSSTSVEMTELDERAGTNYISPHSATSPPFHSPEVQENSEGSQQQKVENLTQVLNPQLPAQQTLPNELENLPSSEAHVPPYALEREKTAPAIGPTSDQLILAQKESDAAGPVLMITLLLTNGARHPYKIDEKYLKKRNISVDEDNPINMSTYTLKELIWREWREGKQNAVSVRHWAENMLIVCYAEWESRPSSPSSIRLIFYGKLLDDKTRLHGNFLKLVDLSMLRLMVLVLEGKFVVGPMNHVVHMTVKPQDIVDEEDAKMAKSGTRERDGNERTHGCRCVIL